MAEATSYHIAGSYYEACNCDAICPCRRQGDVPGGRSTYGDCDFLLSWHITKGHSGSVDVSGLNVAIAGTYNDVVGDDIWSVFIYIDKSASKTAVRSEPDLPRQAWRKSWRHSQFLDHTGDQGR